MTYFALFEAPKIPLALEIFTGGGITGLGFDHGKLSRTKLDLYHHIPCISPRRHCFATVSFPGFQLENLILSDLFSR
ncbi:hypothetical protein XELAEV_18017174mg [Xenopus laevis]|uniref:Uncharacterized protein n=1 Tax=Xenopus laevis TaxID=8355 RepID=A0A974DCU6_XENLA|nr:hypothetical protein XELAEV_18017174mg [Xenopus laevis]